MKYDENNIVAQAREQLAIFAVKPLKRVDARTLTIFQKYGIFDSLKPDADYDEIIPIIEDPDHPDRRPIGSGPLFCYLAKKNPPEAMILNMAMLFLSANITHRKASLGFFNNLEDEEIPFLTSKSRNILKTLEKSLLSEDSLQWRDAAVKIYDTLEADWYFHFAALDQCLKRDFDSGIEEYLTKVIRPTIASVESITIGAWEASVKKKDMQKKLDQIVTENTDVSKALNKYLMTFGHLPLTLDLSIVSMISKWQSTHGNIEDIWGTLWLWADSCKQPLPRYHVCLYFISNPSLVPEGKHKDLWHEVAEVVYQSNDEKEELKWTQSWRMFCEIARHYCCHLETRLPYMNGEIIASQAWWLAARVCNIFTSDAEKVKHLRNETFLPELAISNSIWRIASPCIKPSSLRFLTLNSNSIFSVSLLAALGKNITDLNPKSMDKEDFERIESAITGAILTVYPSIFKKSTEKVYAFDDSLLDTAKRWVKYIEKESKEKEMISAFLSGIEKLIKSESISDLLNKFPNSNSGDQIFISNYLMSIVFTGEAPLSEIWEAVEKSDWREAAFRKSHVAILEFLFCALNEVEARYQDKWAYNLPHFYALEYEVCEDKERKKRLFACVIHSSICGNSVSAIQRLLKGENKQDIQEEVDDWRKRLGNIQRLSPEWVKARIRPVLAVLHL